VKQAKYLDERKWKNTWILIHFVTYTRALARKDPIILTPRKKLVHLFVETLWKELIKPEIIKRNQ